MEELLKACISTMLNEVAAKHGVTPAVLLGTWLLGAVSEPVDAKTASKDLPGPKAKTFDRAKAAKTLPRVNGRFGKKSGADGQEKSAAVESKTVKKKPLRPSVKKASSRSRSTKKSKQPETPTSEG